MSYRRRIRRAAARLRLTRRHRLAYRRVLVPRLHEVPLNDIFLFYYRRARRTVRLDALKIADRLEFSGTVITEELYKVIQESQRAIDYPSMQYSLNLPCVVKDKSKKGCVTQDMWCLDWLGDTEFLKDHADVRQLIFNSFASHGKVVRDSVNNKIGNTENNIRLLISHRNESRSPCAALS